MRMPVQMHWLEEECAAEGLLFLRECVGMLR
jgi:hypothetical protein